MKRLDGINPEFYKMFTRSHELLATAKLKRESEPVDWQEINRLHNEIALLADSMTAMLPASR